MLRLSLLYLYCSYPARFILIHTHKTYIMKCLIASDSRGFALESAIRGLVASKNVQVSFVFHNVSGANIAALANELLEFPNLHTFDLVLFNAGVNNLSVRNRRGLVTHRFQTVQDLVDTVGSEMKCAHSSLLQRTNRLLLSLITGLDVDRYNAYKGRHSNSVELQAVLNEAITPLNRYIQELNISCDLVAPWTSSVVHRSNRTHFIHKYGLMYDGLHPDDTLATKWAERILTMVCRHLNVCYPK